MNPDFWRSRRVFLTGHTGFKGGWLALWLKQLGADVHGFSLAPATQPNLYTVANVARDVHSVFGDVTDYAALRQALAASGAEVVFHCAAQALVRASYADPVRTYATNVLGTVHLLEAVRSQASVRAAVIVTSDKCYEHGPVNVSFRESDRLGGRDPYSSSKACAELVTAAYRASFFDDTGAAGIASARAGNVIGGGDWAPDRLVPDVVRAAAAGEPVRIRYPEAVRPWQHVLEPLHGYLLLAEALHNAGNDVKASWNFGPGEIETTPVAAVVDALVHQWSDGARWVPDDTPRPIEARSLRLDSTQARRELGWEPKLTLDVALAWTIEWYKAHAASSDVARTATLEQIQRYQDLL